MGDKLGCDNVLNEVLRKLGEEKYEYIEYLGSGGFSNVYLVRHKIFNEKHVLKIMKTPNILNHQEDERSTALQNEFNEIKERFIIEAKIYKKIDHPNVVKIYDVDFIEAGGTKNKIPYLIMQHAPGVSLEKILVNKEPLNIRDILHGHTHFDHAMVTETPSTSCICLGANASYTKDKNGFIGFQFIRIEIEPSQKTVVTVWPFKLDDRDGLRFENDYSRWKGQNGKPYLH